MDQWRKMYCTVVPIWKYRRVLTTGVGHLQDKTIEPLSFGLDQKDQICNPKT